MTGSGKVYFKKPGNFLYPVPPVLVSCAGADGKANIFTAAWTGTVCSDPPMVYVSIRPGRYSYELIKETGEFVINLPNRALAKAADRCGCTTGRKTDKWADCRLTPEAGRTVRAPSIREAPVSMECRVRQILPLGTHDMFLAEVTAVSVSERYLDENGAFHMEKAHLIAYMHGSYHEIGTLLGTFGWSVRKQRETGKQRDARKRRKS